MHSHKRRCLLAYGDVDNVAVPQSAWMSGIIYAEFRAQELDESVHRNTLQKATLHMISLWVIWNMWSELAYPYSGLRYRFLPN